MSERRYFIPQQLSGGWQLYGLSPRQLLLLLPAAPITGIGIVTTILLWGAVPAPGIVRLILRAVYGIIPVILAAGWVGIMVIPLVDGGRTLWDVHRLARTHRGQQTVFLPRRMHQPPD